MGRGLLASRLQRRAQGRLGGAGWGVEGGGNGRRIMVWEGGGCERRVSKPIRDGLSQQRSRISLGEGDQSMKIIAGILRFAVLGCSAGLCACIVRPPTIAHVHIGHAVTAVHVTPDHEGYLSVAELRANQAYSAAKSANGDADLVQLKAHIAAAVHATDSQDNFRLRQSFTLPANHISFAATSADASANVVRFAPPFAADTPRVIDRCNYIVRQGKDVASSTSLKEASLL